MYSWLQMLLLLLFLPHTPFSFSSSPSSPLWFPPPPSHFSSTWKCECTNYPVTPEPGSPEAQLLRLSWFVERARGVSLNYPLSLASRLYFPLDKVSLEEHRCLRLAEALGSTPVCGKPHVSICSVVSPLSSSPYSLPTLPSPQS